MDIDSIIGIATLVISVVLVPLILSVARIASWRTQTDMRLDALTKLAEQAREERATVRREAREDREAIRGEAQEERERIEAEGRREIDANAAEFRACREASHKRQTLLAKALAEMTGEIKHLRSDVGRLLEINGYKESHPEGGD